METKVQFGFVAIVGAAAELDVVDCRFATRGIGHDVMKLQKASFGAAATGVTHKGTLPAIALPHCTLDLGRDGA